MPPKNRRGLRTNPLDAVIPDPAAAQQAPEPVDDPAPSAPETASTPATPDTKPSTPRAPEAPAKAVNPDKPVKFNGYVSPEHADRARDALYVLPGEWTTGRFLEHAIDLALADLAEQYNGGKPFAKRPTGQGLRRGPRIT